MTVALVHNNNNNNYYYYRSSTAVHRAKLATATSSDAFARLDYDVDHLIDDDARRQQQSTHTRRLCSSRCDGHCEKNRVQIHQT